MKNKENEWPKSRRLKKADGTIAYIWDGKLHNWEGPALIPEGNERKAEYHLYGIKFSKEDHKEAIRNQTGLPWYKQPAPKGQNHRN
ncbi:hypothetical protein N9L94_01285 [Robiginitalea sp.]|jgi:hypothetical protein|nr:hypothetical protein [Robiginitalea sp.]